MKNVDFVLLYVESPAESTAFYRELLGRPPLEEAPNFSMFEARPGLMLGLWARHDVTPTGAVAGGGGELCFTVGSADEVRSVHADWTKRGLAIAQAPCALDFGFTFVATDPDGHRLRVFAPGAK
jgi:catechol 2,3-dioxygenase-like lactoylglutathione lyase family enzyme